MDFNQLIQQRYSVRAYTSDPVEGDKLQQVLEAARLAPTAANRQPFQLIVIHAAGREVDHSGRPGCITRHRHVTVHIDSDTRIAPVDPEMNSPRGSGASPVGSTSSSTASKRMGLK